MRSAPMNRMGSPNGVSNSTRFHSSTTADAPRKRTTATRLWRPSGVIAPESTAAIPRTMAWRVKRLDQPKSMPPLTARRVITIGTRIHPPWRLAHNAVPATTSHQRGSPLLSNPRTSTPPRAAAPRSVICCGLSLATIATAAAANMKGHTARIDDRFRSVCQASTEMVRNDVTKEKRAMAGQPKESNRTAKRASESHCVVAQLSPEPVIGHAAPMLLGDPPAMISLPARICQ